ncbi:MULTISPECIES: TolC family protein [Parabacteroides]|nr:MULTISPECIES: TolC family protein [Parabacteroides]TFU71944.1 TolC family protein [Parabacteroides sp. P14]MBF0765941.1 TolC family protein [Parabacteroides goldsteinii]MRX90459.1 TolC family protein [Parabacteroides goldsteinii]MRX97563.1 TolC family protein [Parabacteroides goldsteinii]MRY02192.1 TolC family protein [Parabacteroides goldsteinii]
MKQVSLIILSCLLLLPAGMKAEDDMPKQWTLRNCIDYALEHNITIRRNRINVESTQEDVKTAKADFLPSLSGNISQRIVNRPNSASGTIISGDNITTSESKTSYNGSYGIDANWTVYNGSKRVNTLKQQQLNSRVAELTVDESENSIEENITQLYVQILYSAEAVKVNESTLEVSRKEFERGQELFNAGSIASSDLAQLEAQVSNDNYQLVTSQTTLQNYKLQLKQLLELDGDFEMDLFLPPLDDSSVLIPLPTKDDVYQTALNLRPEIESSKLNIEASDMNIKISRAGYIPSLSLSAGIGTTNANGNDFSFSEQVKQNWNNSIGLTLSIPIFDKRQTKSAVNKAKLQRQTSELDLMDNQKTLYKTIESLWLSANSAQQQYVAATQKLKSTQASYALVSEQFNLGMKNTVELLTEKNNLLSAQQETLQAKYTAILNASLLRFYQGEEIDLL